MSTPTTPTTVEVGQIWRDNDQRTRGSGEFVVLDLIGAATSTQWAYDTYGDMGAVAVARARLGRGKVFAIVQRDDTGRRARIDTDRLLNGTNTQRGYTYLGMSR